MNFGSVFICFILVVSINAEPFELLDDFFSAIFYRSLESNIRQMDILESLKNNYTIKDTAELVEQYNYAAEKHDVITEDGYIVTIFRISGSPTSPPADDKRVVFLEHGLLESSDSWVLMGEGCDLAFLLAAEGYDIWIGNIRGNTYGRNHVNLTTEDDAFWNYSYHEIGTLDLPAMIDYVLEHTGQTDLVYVGHSMGTSIVYVLLSEKPEYNDKFRLTISLAPIAYWVDSLNQIWSFIRDIYPIITASIKIFDITDTLPRGVSEKIGGTESPCRRDSISQPLCIFLLIAFFGKDVQEFNYDLLPYILLYNPAGISIRSVQQFLQNVNTGQFRQWDYGKSNNEKIYGASEPPEYNVTKISAPCAFFYSPADPLATEKVMAILLKNKTNEYNNSPNNECDNNKNVTTM